MIPSYWYTPAAAFLWQVFLHSVLAGTVFFVWARYLRLPSGRPRRWMLSALLALPLATALVPGRNSFDFREQEAWFDSLRVLSMPLPGGWHLYHAALAIACLSVAISIWQELVPVLRRFEAGDADVPAPVERRVRAMPNWERAQVGILREDGIILATTGWPWRPRLLVSEGALRAFTDDEWQAVLRHESAHWRRGRWWFTHLLFACRMIQCFNPVALWVFREYSIEVEIDCDADAVADRAPKSLARALLKIYESTGGRDLSVRSTLRKRIDILLGRVARGDDTLPMDAVVIAALALLFLLPWTV